MTRWIIILLSSLLIGCVTTPDDLKQSYLQAEVYGPEDRPVGVVLYLHGCDGLSFDWEWADLFIQQGWQFVATNSIADPRPDFLCGSDSSNHHIKEGINQFRAKQARYALEQLAIDYPRLPIIVWGHSEGAAVANLLDDQVAGIFTTGHRCGYWNYGWTKFHPEVPVLVIIGTDDIHVPESKPQIQANCERVLRSDLQDYLILDNVAHHPSPRNRLVKKRMLAWLNDIVG